jgi:hypothetical protein
MSETKVIIYSSPQTWEAHYVPKEKTDLVREVLSSNNQFFVFVETNENS